MAKVKEMLAYALGMRKVSDVKPEIPEGLLEMAKEEAGIKKANKLDKLRRLCKSGRKVAFSVYTPSTEQGRLVHSTILRDAVVSRTSHGDYIITGRDIEEELKFDLSNGVQSEKLKSSKRRKKSDLKFRAYRIDRIIDGTILW